MGVRWLGDMMAALRRDFFSVELFDEDVSGGYVFRGSRHDVSCGGLVIPEG